MIRRPPRSPLFPSTPLSRSRTAPQPHSGKRVPVAGRAYLNPPPSLVVTPTNTRGGVSRHNPTLPPASTTIHSAGRKVTAPSAPHSADAPAPAVSPYSSVVSP